MTAKVDGRTVAAGNARLMEKLGLKAPAVSETGTIVHVAIEGMYAGYLLIADVVKPHSAQAIRGLKDAGVRKTVMLTGDAEPVAKAVSAELGLDEYHAGLLPGDKVDQIETLLAAKRPKENLAFVGDGINDAPVLSRADVGIAMGALGSDAAIEAADVVLMDDDPAKIALAMPHCPPPRYASCTRTSCLHWPSSLPALCWARSAWPACGPPSSPMWA